MKSQADALLMAVSESGCAGADKEMEALITAARQSVDTIQTRRVLDRLRSLRCFGLMETFATEAAKLAEGNLRVYVERQRAQAMIELDRLTEAIGLLESLAADAEQSRERSEVSGLLGRVQKQRFVKAAGAGASGEAELRAAVAAYLRDYSMDPAWHGANLVALVARAEREGFSAGTDSANKWAQRLLDDLYSQAQAGWSPWDYAAAGEAYLALYKGEGGTSQFADKVARNFAQYWNSRNTDAFALAGTERNLREIWQIRNDDPADELGSSLLLHLEARRLTAAGGGARYTAAQLCSLARRLQTASGQAEATFGAGSAIPLERVLDLLHRARSVCRVTDRNDRSRSGTGFLVRGSDLQRPEYGILLLTNHHVLHGEEATEELLAREDYRGSIDVERAEAEFHFWEGPAGTGAGQPRRIRLKRMVGHSERLPNRADFALAELSEEVPDERALSLSKKLKPLGSRNLVDPRQRSKVIVVGHPGGFDLRFSVSDNEVVDHELDDGPAPGPRRIHYRAPTEPGSSGSPVFHYADLDVVGLHRTGRAKPLRPDWPRAQDDERYEANEAVSVRALLGL